MVNLTFVEVSEKESAKRCEDCLFCLKENIVDADMDYGHEPCALEQTVTYFPEQFLCFPVNERSKGVGRNDGKFGYWKVNS